MSETTEPIRNIVGGCVLVALGLGACWKALTGLHVGTLANMGPGFFPIILGGGLVLCGAVLTVGALVRGWATGGPQDAPALSIRPRALILLALSVALFALSVKTLGLIPAAFFLVTVAAFADPRTTAATALALGVGLSVASWLIFVSALGMPLAAFAI